MRSILFILLINTLVLNAQKLETTIYYEKEGDDIVYYADNLELGTVSLLFEAELVQIESSAGKDFFIVMPGLSKRNFVTKLTAIGNRKMSFKVKTKAVYGDLGKTKYDNLLLDLPFKSGLSYKIFQGYNGRETHRGENSLDFGLKIGDEIHAAFGGKVVKIEQGNSGRCARPECAENNNYVVIEHQDGSFAEYVHIIKNGARVKIGEEVKAGQLIAISGDVGYATGPHLHFSVFIPDKSGRKTIKTKFKINDGNKSEFLDDQKTYLKNY